MKLALMFIFITSIISCANFQKSRIPANSEDILTITIPKSEFASVGSTKSEQRMRDGTTWTSWSRFVINEIGIKIDDRTTIKCAMEYFGNPDALWMQPGKQVTFSSVPIPPGHVFPRVSNSPSQNHVGTFSSRTNSLLFKLGTNQTLSSVCVKTILNPTDSDAPITFTLNEMSAIYPNLRLSEPAEVHTEPVPTTTAQ